MSVRQELPSRRPVILERYPDGTALVTEDEGVDTFLYDLYRETAAGLAKLGRKYRRCGMCSPDIAEWVDPSRQAVRVDSLNTSHLGRPFEAIGKLQEFRCTADGWTLIGEDGQTLLPDRGVAYYVKGV